MSIHHMTRPQLIAKMERDQAAVDRAAASLADLVSLQAEVAQLKRDLAVANSKAALVIVKQVPGPIRTIEKRVEVPGPVRTVVKEVPGPERTITKVQKMIEVKEVPCPKQAAKIKEMRAVERKMKAKIARLTERANRPPRVEIKQVPGPVRTVEKRVEVPGPTRTVIKEVPGPVRTITKEVATPCPKQAEEIKALQHRLSEFADCDMDKFKQWRKMVDVAKGKK